MPLTESEIIDFAKKDVVGIIVGVDQIAPLLENARNLKRRFLNMVSVWIILMLRGEDSKFLFEMLWNKQNIGC